MRNRFQPANASTPSGSKNSTNRFVEQLVSDELEKSAKIEEKELENQNNQHGVDGTQPSSKSRARRKPAAGASSRRSRITDSYVRALEWKCPNALKHGAFSDNPAVTGENSEEFEELHSALMDEWQPSGPTEEEAVHSIAHDMWRKRRGQRFLQAMLFVNTYDQLILALINCRAWRIFTTLCCRSQKRLLRRRRAAFSVPLRSII